MESICKVFESYRGRCWLKRVFIEWRVLTEFHLDERDLRYAMCIFRMGKLADKYDLVIQMWQGTEEQPVYLREEVLKLNEEGS